MAIIQSNQKREALFNADMLTADLVDLAGILRGDEVATPESIIFTGDTWRRDAKTGKFVQPLPGRTLGDQALVWIYQMLRDDEGNNFMMTREQMRFLRIMYDIDDKGKFVNTSLCLQRVKGWGKSPFSAAIAALEAFGPSRFDRFDAFGRPVAKEQNKTLVQLTAVSREQTRFIMDCFKYMFSPQMKTRYKIGKPQDDDNDDIGQRRITGMGGKRIIEAISATSRSAHGAQATFILADETHQWIKWQGHDAWDSSANNAEKAKGGNGRIMSITNAYDPAEDSVAQRIREGWENQFILDEHGEPLQVSSGLYYDTLEASPSAVMAAGVDEAQTKLNLSRCCGDSVWIDVERRYLRVLEGSAGKMLRYYYNNVISSEMNWIDRSDWNICGKKAAAFDLIVTKSDECVLAFDGSKSYDATALVLTRLKDGYVFKTRIWERDPKAKTWQVDRDDVSATVEELFSSYNIVAFWGDPSYAVEDVSKDMYWDKYLDEWHRKYKDRLLPQFWAEPNKHSIRWDMTKPVISKQFVQAAMRVHGLIVDHALLHSGDRRLTAHVIHAFKKTTNLVQGGETVVKKDRNSVFKIDACVCMIITQAMVQIINNSRKEQKVIGGMPWIPLPI